MGDFVVEAAALHLSSTKAAQELFLKQSAVRRQIQAIEAHIGVAPFAGHNKASSRAYFVELAHKSGERLEVRAFADWLLREAAGP